jgi:hypothetical protein
MKIPRPNYLRVYMLTVKLGSRKPDLELLKDLQNLLGNL